MCELHRRGPASQIMHPVCGMTVDPRTSRNRDVGGRALYFCSRSCEEMYLVARNVPGETGNNRAFSE